MSDRCSVDPAVFDSAGISAETAALNSKVEKHLSAVPPTYTFRPRVIRAARLAGGLIWGPIRYTDDARDRKIAGPADEIALRVFVPDENFENPDISPLHADLNGMPPAIFTIGTLDPLLDDTLFMYMRWLTAGNAAELAVYPGGIHAFDALPLEIANRANARIRKFISEMTIE